VLAEGVIEPLRGESGTGEQPFPGADREEAGDVPIHFDPQPAVLGEEEDVRGFDLGVLRVGVGRVFDIGEFGPAPAAGLVVDAG